MSKGSHFQAEYMVKIAGISHNLNLEEIKTISFFC